jgi:hypothetical protein
MTCAARHRQLRRRRQQQSSAIGGLHCLHDGATISARCCVADVGKPIGVGIVMLAPGPVKATSRSVLMTRPHRQSGQLQLLVEYRTATLPRVDRDARSRLGISPGAPCCCVSGGWLSSTRAGKSKPNCGWSGCGICATSVPPAIPDVTRLPASIRCRMIRPSAARGRRTDQRRQLVAHLLCWQRH